MGIASGRDATWGQKNFHGLYSRCCIDCSVFFERVHFVENETRKDYPRCRQKVSSTCYNLHRTISVRTESKEVDSWSEIELGKQRDCVPWTLRFRAVSLGSTGTRCQKRGRKNILQRVSAADVGLRNRMARWFFEFPRSRDRRKLLAIARV